MKESSVCRNSTNSRREPPSLTATFMPVSERRCSDMRSSRSSASCLTSVTVAIDMSPAFIANP